METIISKIGDRRSFFKGTDTMSVGYPWLAFGAIISLEYLVNDQMRVLEFGGGGSTLWFGKKCKFAKTIETDYKWTEMLIKKIGEMKLDNVEITYSTSELESVTLALQEPDESYDIILVDSGWLEGHKSPNRRLLFETAIPKLKKGGYLIIDNYLHYGMKNFDYKGFEVFTYDEFGYSGKGTKICVKL